MIQKYVPRVPETIPPRKKMRPFLFWRWRLVSLLLILALFPVPMAHAKLTAKDRYSLAEKEMAKLMTNPSLQKYRDKWLKCIDQFYGVYETDPSGPYASAGLYKAGALYLDLSRISWLESDEENAKKIFETIVQKYPKSKYHMQAVKHLKAKSAVKKSLASSGEGPKTLRPKVGKSKSAPSPEPPPFAPPKKDSIQEIILDEPQEPKEEAYSNDSQESPSPAANGRPAIVTSLRFWSNPSYTRVVVKTKGEPNYSHHMLKKDPSNNKPQRLFIDLANSRIAPSLDRQIPINDHLLDNVRAGQNTPESTRVVIDIKSYDNYKVFTLRNPFRIVVDVWGKKGKTPKESASSGSPPVSSGGGDNTPLPGKLSKGSLAQQLALGVKTIVIDPGHGGKDYGAKGYISGVHEKHITLALGLMLSKMVREKLNCHVIMTRTTDRYIPLEERTAIANTKNADLFISIHTNAHRNSSAHGIETYFLNLATDEAAISVAARENATSTKNISDLQSILDSLMQNSKINESMRLAGFVQNTMTSKMKKSYSNINNKGVKQAPFYVLLGAQMPAVLVETSFISNPRECKRLTDPKYQIEICEGILGGVRRYIQATNPTALYNPAPKKSRS